MDAAPLFDAGTTRVSFSFIWRVVPNARAFDALGYVGLELFAGFSSFSLHEEGSCRRFAGGFWEVEGRFCEVCEVCEEERTDSDEATWPFNAS